jgi:hypothetical protein
MAGRKDFGEGVSETCSRLTARMRASQMVDFGSRVASRYPIKSMPAAKSLAKTAADIRQPSEGLR